MTLDGSPNAMYYLFNGTPAQIIGAWVIVLTLIFIFTWVIYSASVKGSEKNGSNN